MGYYTWYNLEIEPTPDPEHPVWDEMVDDDTLVKDIVTDGYDGKWYENEAELTMLSIKYPSLLFIVDGSGEDSGDVWREYFKDGKHFMACQPDWEPPEYKDIENQMQPWDCKAPGEIWIGNTIYCQQCLVQLVISSSGGNTFVAGEVDDNIKEELVCPKCGFTKEKPDWYPREVTE